MPNHVHLLVRMGDAVGMGKVVQAWKGYTGKRIQQLTGGHPGPVWQREYWDRYIRDEKHFLQALEYIHQNPVKAGLVARAEDWIWSSFRELAEQTLGALGDNP
jgi:REP element-mobilizing transposase RayT